MLSRNVCRKNSTVFLSEEDENQFAKEVKESYMKRNELNSSEPSTAIKEKTDEKAISKTFSFSYQNLAKVYDEVMSGMHNEKILDRPPIKDEIKANSVCKILSFLSNVVKTRMGAVFIHFVGNPKYRR